MRLHLLMVFTLINGFLLFSNHYYFQQISGVRAQQWDIGRQAVCKFTIDVTMTASYTNKNIDLVINWLFKTYRI